MPSRLSGKPVVFYISSHGLAGDHWFEWFAKALNAHLDVMIFMGESTRSKYLKERSRKDRPDLLAYTKFLTDVGRPYQAVGDCYAYRSYQLEALWGTYGDEIRFVNLVRHPYCWLGYYVDWRCANMNMPLDDTSGVDHEWSVTCHDEIASYDLEPYGREDIHIWTAYQGMNILNRMVSDRRPGVRNVRLEEVVSQRDTFVEAVDYVTHGAVAFEAGLLDQIYSWVDRPFHEKGIIRSDPQAEYAAWPDWKKEAFTKIVKPETRELFVHHGYTL